MNISISDEKIKEMLTEILVEMITQKRELFYEIVLEAIEDAGLSNAISEGSKNDFVNEEEVLSFLKDTDED